MEEFANRMKQGTLYRLFKRYEKYMPILFFIGGFIFDSLTLGRIDRLYDMTMLWLYMLLLTATLYAYNLADDGRWKDHFLERAEPYFPLIIQFFFGGLSSAFVIYFSRSVSLSKTASFFVILLVLFLANEFLKSRISNKYLQFSIYFFVQFTFLAVMLPVLLSEMNTAIFIISGILSLSSTLIFISAIYGISPSTQKEISLRKISFLIVLIYIAMNAFYYFNLIPPVPLALQNGMVAHRVEVIDNRYHVTYEKDHPLIFWRDHRIKYIHQPGDPVYIFSAVFAPTDLKKSIIHQWQFYSPEKMEWEIVDNIGYSITGGRDRGYRGYTYKSNVWEGKWRVKVITEDEFILGVIDFEIINEGELRPGRLITRSF
ncbi:DUF2914 domain-containing protein [Robertkochia marina]|uniref:DUF2914 domain-containing protein n=1 Tax=Robertkochia marina TaxID=1227945 RepID=A0A4S3M2A3_9FLAO|nr:DUF2914 domain-containing protein [Robertkochia marina]THD69163.1 DUF2914 domain-containing protein [Robertkochia marina]TRZ47579.1 DUF2914 domain-containing protein [Robertkochia marina]